MPNRTGRLGAKVKYGRKTSTIVRKLPNLAYGAVMVEPPIDGLRFWNMQELEYVKGSFK